MSTLDRYTVQDLREMANTVHDAGLGARGQGIYALLLGLALEKESTSAYRDIVSAVRKGIADYEETFGEAPSELAMTDATARAFAKACRQNATVIPDYNAIAGPMYFYGIPIRIVDR